MTARSAGWLLGVLLLTMPQFLRAQVDPVLRIVSPVPGFTLKQGDSFTVFVTTSGAVNGAELISGAGGVSETQPVSAENSFHITVPSDLSPGIYSVIAVIYTGEKTLESPPIQVNVTASYTVDKIIVNNNRLELQYTGDQDRLDVRERTDKGSKILENNLLTFRSLDTSVVTVDSGGTFTAQKAGITQIVISYDGVSASAYVVVKSSTKRGDLNADGQVDIRDLEVLEQGLDTSASAPNDARDFNHDGKIDALDARILTTLCTYPHCATHP